MSNPFTLALVQAVSDWQRSPTEKNKLIRGQRLKEQFAALPAYFRECDRPCFRQECHQKGRTFQLVIQDALSETIASWTTSLDVAKSFKGGVAYGPDDRSVIFGIVPPGGTVVANLEKLYAEPEFQQALDAYGSQVDHFHNGAGKYRDTQKEVVLELGSLSLRHVHSYGGYSGTLDDLIGAFALEHGRAPDEQEISQLEDLAGQPWWLSEEGTWEMLSRVVDKFSNRIDEILRK